MLFILHYRLEAASNPIIENKQLHKGCHPFKKVQFFLTLFKRPFTPPPFYLNICPILQGVFFNNVETDMKYM